MFACLAADYPREPRTGEPDLLGDAERRLAAGEISVADHDAVVRDVVRTVLAEQETSGLAVLTDGAIAHADRLAALVEGLGGARSSRTVGLPDGATAAAPRFDGRVEWRGPITVAAWQSADAMTDLLVKQVLVGPFTIARLAEPTGASRRDLAVALAEAMNAELRALADAGCQIIQIDEGALTAIDDDDGEWRLYGETQRRLTDGLHDHHLSLGLYRGAVHPARHGTVLDGPYRSYVFDALGGPDAWRFAFAVPPERGLVVGALDAAQDTRDETEVMVWAMAWAAERDRETARIGISSNGSLRGIGRHAARRKIELMGEAVRVAGMGPLREVAEALDPAPAESTMVPLRQLAEAVDAARTPT
jgi:methionine synthase II (cobalamin-independent)